MDSESKHFVAVKINKHEYKNFSVPEPVWRYIRQLEKAIESGDYTGIKKLYPKFESKDEKA